MHLSAVSTLLSTRSSRRPVHAFRRHIGGGFCIDNFFYMHFIAAPLNFKHAPGPACPEAEAAALTWREMGGWVDGWRGGGEAGQHWWSPPHHLLVDPPIRLIMTLMAWRDAVNPPHPPPATPVQAHASTHAGATDLTPHTQTHTHPKSWVPERIRSKRWISSAKGKLKAVDLLR
jgi:hypothetical protein